MDNLRFKVGDRVKIKRRLHADQEYYMENGYGEYFSRGMEANKGKEATIISADKYGYKLDIDKMYNYTDEMLIKLRDNIAKSDTISEKYKDEVESLVEHMLKLFPQQQIDYALDTGNKELFDKLTRQYTEQEG